MEGRRNGGTGIAGGGNNNRQITVAARLQPRQRTGQEARADVLERRGRSMEQLQHMVTIAERAQRDREVEGLAADRRQRAFQRIAGKERRQQISGGIGQGCTGLQFTRCRQNLGHIQPAIGRQSCGDCRTEADSR